MGQAQEYEKSALEFEHLDSREEADLLADVAPSNGGEFVDHDVTGGIDPARLIGGNTHSQ